MLNSTLAQNLFLEGFVIKIQDPVGDVTILVVSDGIVDYHFFYNDEEIIIEDYERGLQWYYCFETKTVDSNWPEDKEGKLFQIVQSSVREDK